MNFPRVTIGRRELSDVNYSRWAAYVTVHLDDAIGFVADIDTGDAQEDVIADATDEQRATILEALAGIWSAWEALGTEPLPGAHFVPPPPPTLPDMAAIELPIAKGQAQHAMLAALANLTASVLMVERVAMACARAIDETRAP